MSRMLNLVDELLSRSRHFHKLGRRHEAFDLLTRLADLREMPIHTAEEVEVRLGESYLRQRRYKQARRHFATALTFQPDNARYHFFLAHALSHGPRPNPRRASEHYARSLELDSGKPIRLSAFGLFLVQIGRSAEGLRHLRRAAKIAPESPAVLKRVLAGLLLANRAEEARRVLLNARFCAPHDPRVLALWNDLHFQMIRKEQQTALLRPKANRLESPVLLPFDRPRNGGSSSCRTRAAVRQDGPSGTPAPRSILRVRKPGQRHAQ
jgi:Flp pilus assembly protein TadD